MLSSCNAGTVNQTSLTGVFAVAFIDFCLIFGYYLSKWYKRKGYNRKVSDSFYSETMSKDSVVSNKDSVVRPSKPRKNSTVSLLVDYFRRGFNGKGIKTWFSFSDMGLKLPNGKVVLTGVTGEIRSAKMTAIMGPSGAGKTTFMNVLCGKVTRTCGKLLVLGLSLLEILLFLLIL